MKKYLFISLSALLTTLFFSNCKKEDASTTQKDYSRSIKDKVWWGTLTNAGEQPQYYSVHFSSGNLLLWSQFSGDYTGQYSIDENKLTMTFINPAVVVTAEITDDNKLKNITTSTLNKVNTGELVENPNIPLEGTVWKGDGNFNLIAPTALQLSFLAGAKVQFKLTSTTFTPGTYTRSASGGAIRFYVPTLLSTMFCVITSGDRMIGSYDSPMFLWQMAKQ